MFGNKEQRKSTWDTVENLMAILYSILFLRKKCEKIHKKKQREEEKKETMF